MKLVEPVLFIDCQTTGATPKTAHLLELGWSYGRATDSAPVVHTRLVALPEAQVLPPRIEKITGITKADMDSAFGAEAVISDLLSALGNFQSNSSAIAVAHYAQFERAFVGQLFSDQQRQLPFDFICTCQIAKRLYPDLPSRAIRALGGYFGLSLSEMKRSSCHVEATFYIWQRLVRDLAALGIDDDQQLLEWLSKPLVKNLTRNPYAIPMERLKRLDLPDKPGIYRMLNSSGKILYVGKATSLKSRVNSYFRGRKGKDSKTKELISQIFDIAVEVVATPLEAALLETDLIKRHDPPYNRALRQRGRVLYFYNYNFDSASQQQDSTHRFGPFVSDAFKPLLDVLTVIQTKKYPLELFWGLATEELIASAFAIITNEGPLSHFEPEQLNGRRLLAIGMVLLRHELRQIRAIKLEEARLQAELASKLATDCTVLDGLEGQEHSEIVDDLEDELENLEERELNETDLVDMIYGILIRSARMHIQAKKLTVLLNSRISFLDGKVSRTLTFVNGRNVDTLTTIDKELPWHALEIDTYDRMRVLLTELTRVTLRGSDVSIEELKVQSWPLRFVG